MTAGKKIWKFLRRSDAEQEPSDAAAQGAEAVSVRVRKYHRRDREAVLRIAAESFRGVCLDENIEKAFGKTGASWQEHKMDTVDYDLEGHTASCLVAEVDGKVVGFACNRLYHNRSVGHMANLAVLEQYQGKGVGKALLGGSLDHFREMGMRFARIETLEQNERGQKFYTSAGFQEVGRQIFYFKKL